MKLINLFKRYMAEAESAEGAPAGGDAPAEESAAGDPPAEGTPTDDPKPDEGEGKPEGGESEEGAADYADLEMPEGVELDTAALDEFTPVFKEMNLTKEQVQKLATKQAELLQAKQQEAVEAFETQKQTWYDETIADKEIGGDKFEESAKTANVALDKFGTPELKELLVGYGLANHKEMVRFMARVGKAAQEDSPGNGGDQASGKKDPASILYPE